MFQQARWSMPLLIALFLLPAVLLWAAQKQGQTTSSMRNLLHVTLGHPGAKEFLN